MKKIYFLIILISCYFSTIYAQSGLVGCYPLDSNANDFSGNNYNGTAFNVTATMGHSGVANTAYHFSGSGSYIQLPTTGYLLDQFTFSAWCRLTNLPASGNVFTILSIGGNTEDQVMNMANNSSGNQVGFAAGSYDSNGMGYACLSGYLPNINQWYHVVETRDNSSVSLYIDGVYICSKSIAGVTAGYAGSPVNATIGTRHTSGIQSFIGDIDNVKIFNRVLSLSEIQNITDSCTSIVVSCLAGCYPLDTNANDLSGNNYNGTAYNVTAAMGHSGVANTAYHFSGSGSYIQLPTTGYLLDQFTYSAWCRLASLPSSGNTVTVFSIGGNTEDQVMNMANNSAGSQVGFGAGSWGSNTMGYACFSGYLPNLNQWYHVVETRDNSTVSLYIDGVYICSKSISGVTAGYAGSPVNATIGIRHITGSQDFIGDIDDVRIYNCVLSITEIQNISASCTFLTNIESFNNSAWDVYPNPSNGKFTVFLPKAIGDISIKVFNTLGQNIYQENFSKIASGQKDIELKTASGIYFIQLNDGEKQLTKKIIVE